LSELSQILGFFGIGSACLPILILLIIRICQKDSIGYSLFHFMAFEYFIINITTLGVYFMKLYQFQSWLYGIHYFLELFILSLFLIPTIKKYFYSLFLTILIFTSFFCGLLIYQGICDFDKYIALFSNVTLLILSLNFVLKKYNANEVSNLFSDGEIVIFLGVMFFNAIQIYFSLFEVLIRDNKGVIFFYLWPIFQLVGIIYYLTFSVGLWKLRKS
jgi:hypothetical protein